jgi:hypothetical protein
MNSLAIARVLVTIAFFLIFVSVGGQLTKLFMGYEFNRFLRLFDLSLEQNIPTFFSVLLMIFASLLLSIIALLQGKKKYPDVSKWAILSFGFLLMAYDEGFQVHEDLVGFVRPLLGEGDLGIFYYAWVVPALPFVFFLALFFCKFLYRLPVKTRLNFLMAATLFLAGCIGFEMIGGHYDELYGHGRYDPLYGYENFTYNMISTVEESLEMAGLIFFIYALLVYIEENYQQVHFRLTDIVGKTKTEENTSPD